jgi:1-deoxy-D-xylulose 5-phosphate reductoisomerase
MIKSLAVLGASGSVGSQVLEVLENRDDYCLVAISCWSNIEFVKKVLNKFSSVKFVTIRDKSSVELLKNQFKNVSFYYGDEGLIKMIDEANCDVYENSILGFAGLFPSIEVLKQNKVLLLSNKESLVVGGEYINSLLKDGFGKLFPIDSEHVAIKKCLYGKKVEDIDYIVLTASGGKFFDYSRKDLENVSFDDCFSNPNWSMGKKISVDSNTMMNKMFEIVEAHYLFNLPYEKIHVLVDRNSYVHSFVVFNDETRLQVGKPTMKDPIIYALNFGLPEDLKMGFKDVEINTENNYKFMKVISSRFPVLKLAKKIINEKGCTGCVINAIDEVVVDAFLKNEIEFKDIDVMILSIIKEYKFNNDFSLNNLKEIDLNARSYATEYIKKMRR